MVSCMIVSRLIFEHAKNIAMLHRGTFLRDFLVILKQMLQNNQELMKKCFLVNGSS